MKVFVIEESGCEWGGINREAAYASEELAQNWINEHTNKRGTPLNIVVDAYTIYELEVRTE